MSTRATVRASELYADLQDVAAQYEHCLSVHKLSSDMSYLFSSESVRLAFAILPGSTIRCDSQVKILLQTKNKTILCTLLVKDRETTKNIIVNILDAMLDGVSHFNQSYLYSTFKGIVHGNTDEYNDFPMGFAA